MVNERMKYGLEKEFFVLDKNKKPIVVPDYLPADECGLLAEARGKPFHDITDAVFSLKSEIHKLRKIAKKHNLTLCDKPIMKISDEVMLEARRKYEKGLIKYSNLYGHLKHRNKPNETVAGVHISFTQPMTERCGKTTIEYNTLFDFVSIFKKLDEKFKEEIKSAKRNPGFYEIKCDGRVEYRSLPSNVNLMKVIDVINSL